MERGLLALPRRMSAAFTGVVLAGGRSSRMGRDKAGLVLDGRTLLDRAIDVLHVAGAERVIVAGGDRATVVDGVAGQGPVGGIASVLATGIEGAVLVMPVDMPALDAASLRQLVDALADAPAACFAGHRLPWAARADARLREAVAAALASRPGGPSMRELHRAVAGIELESADAGTLRNVNTPADWEAFAR